MKEERVAPFQSNLNGNTSPLTKPTERRENMGKTIKQIIADTIILETRQLTSEKGQMIFL